MTSFSSFFIILSSVIIFITIKNYEGINYDVMFILFVLFLT